MILDLSGSREPDRSLINESQQLRMRPPNTNIKEGFGFLGFNVRKYNGKLLIKPAKKSVTSLLEKVRDTIKSIQELFRRLRRNSVDSFSCLVPARPAYENSNKERYEQQKLLWRRELHHIQEFCYIPM